MKITRILSIVALLMSSTFISFGQNRVATAISADNFATDNVKGVYSFIIPADISEKEVALSAEYYTMYFSVVLNTENHQTVVTLKESTDNARHIICRFIISLGLNEVEFNRNSYQVEDFYQKFLRSEKN